MEHNTDCAAWKKAMIYITTNARTTFAPHCNKAFVTSMSHHYYYLLEFFCACNT